MKLAQPRSQREGFANQSGGGGGLNNAQGGSGNGNGSSNGAYGAHNFGGPGMQGGGGGGQGGAQGGAGARGLAQAPLRDVVVRRWADFGLGSSTDIPASRDAVNQIGRAHV